MRNITRLTLLMLTLGTGFQLQANPDELWSEERCTQLRQLNQSDTPLPQQVQQQLQQHCTGSVVTRANIMPVQLDVEPATAAESSAPLQRVRHNSTLETLGSAMLLVLVGFWLWMGRK